jgi:carbonic anhydrase
VHQPKSEQVHRIPSIRSNGMTYEEIFINNRKWVESKQRADAGFFQKLATGQKPEFLFIGCSDSRVTAEEMMGAGPGDIFIHRNIANLVPNNDICSAAVVEYSISHLRVKHIIVCGHYVCGGVKAAMQAQDLGILNPWLRNIRDVYRLHKDELGAIADLEARYDRLVELNIQEQCLNVVKMASFQKSFLETGRPEIHGWVFDVKSGNLIDLKIDIRNLVSSIREIYDLGTTKK